jgi:putative membrane protein
MASDLRDDPRVYLAAERTLLAWIRTGLALMGFGFVVARFGLFIRELAPREVAQQFTSTGFSFGVGIALVLAGVFVNVAATVHHVRLTAHLISGDYLSGRPSYFAAAVAIFLALIGIAMAIFLVVVK